MANEKEHGLQSDLIIKNMELTKKLYGAKGEQTRLLFYVLIGSSLANVFLVWLAFFHFPVNNFVATSNAAAICNVSPVSEPFVHHQIVSDFAVDAAVSIYSFDHANYMRQINDATNKYFLESYRNQFLVAFGDSQLLRAVKENFYVVSATKGGRPPMISKSGLVKGVYTWRVQVPLVVTYITGRKSEEDRQLLTLDISRTQPSLLNPRGIAVSGVNVSRLVN